MSEKEPEGRVIPPDGHVIPETTHVIPAKAGIQEQHAEDDEPVPIPWHFKLLMVALTLYLGFRAFQGVDWVWQHFH